MNPALKALDDALKNRPIPSSFDAVKGAPEAERSSVVNENIPNITATDRATILTAWKNAVQDPGLAQGAAPAGESRPFFILFFILFILVVVSPGPLWALRASQARKAAAKRGLFGCALKGIHLTYTGFCLCENLHYISYNPIYFILLNISQFSMLMTSDPTLTSILTELKNTTIDTNTVLKAYLSDKNTVAMSKVKEDQFSVALQAAGIKRVGQIVDYINSC